LLVFDTDSESLKPGAMTELKAYNKSQRKDVPPLLTLAWEVVDLGAVSISNNLSVRLRGIDFTPEQSQSSRARLQAPLRYVRGSKRRTLKSMSPTKYLQQIRLSRFNCEASSKSKKFTYVSRYTLQKSASNVHWDAAELFVVKAGRGTAKATRHFIPFNLSLFLSRDEFDWV
jgi:hypothetical protein